MDVPDLEEKFDEIYRHPQPSGDLRARRIRRRSTYTGEPRATQQPIMVLARDG